MKIREIQIENFGKLHQKTFSFTDGFNGFCLENGWGKSTLCTFLSVMFYGFTGELKRNSLENERKRFYPWQGGTYGGSVVFEAAGNVYRLVRTFGSKESEDSFALYDYRTGKVSTDYSERIGNELFLMDQDSFRKSACILSSDLDTAATGQMKAQVSQKRDAASDMGQYEKIMEMLRQKLLKESPDRKTGRIFKLDSEITMEKKRLMELANIEKQIEESKKILLGKREKYDSCKKEWEKAREDKIRCESDPAYWKHFFAKEENKDKLAEYKDYMRQAERNMKGRKTWLFLALFLSFFCVFLFGAALVCLIREERTMAIFLGILFLALGVLDAFFLRKFADRNSQKKEQVKVKEKAKEYALAEYKKRADRLEKEQISLQKNILEEEKKVEELFLLRDEREEVLARLLALEEEKEKSLKKWKLVKLTREYLEKAMTEQTLRYAMPVRNSMKKYSAYFSDTMKDKVKIDADLELSIEEAGKNRETSFFSTGKKCLTELCFRLSMLDAMYQTEKPMLIMDDPFISLDTESTKKAVKLLKNISEYQILYFTCHESRLETEEEKRD